jgi:negative regulator of sigma E activity
MEDKKYSKLKAAFEATQPQVPDDFTKRVMKRIEEQTSVLQSKRHRVWFYPTIAVAASVLLLISLGIVFSNQSDEGNNLVAQTDTTIVSPQTGAKEVETRPQEKK